MMCKRCGIDIDYSGLCDDCVEVTGVPKAIHTYTEPKPHRGYVVRSSRYAGQRIPNRDELMEQVRLLNSHGYSANEIALQVGVTTRTVTRWRNEMGIRSQIKPADSFSHVRDQDAARAYLAEVARGLSKYNR